MAMKLMIGLLVVIAVLGVMSGFQAWYSPSPWMKVQGAAAILISVNLLFITWQWGWGRPGFREAMFAFILISVAMLVGFMPRVFWPTQEVLGIGASGVSIILSIIAVILVLRWNRRQWVARGGTDS
jgi:hypothetical protein